MLKPFVRDRRDKAIYLNEALRYVRGGFLVPSTGQNPVTIPVTAVDSVAKAAGSVIIEAPGDSYTEIFGLIGAHGAANDVRVNKNMTVEITDTTYRRRLMNRDVPVDHVFGSAQLPFRLAESLLLEPQGGMSLQFYNNAVVAAGAGTYSMSLLRRKFQQASWVNPHVKPKIAEMRNRKPWLYPFWLTLDTPVSVASTSAYYDTFFTVSRDIYFCALGMIHTLFSPGTAVTYDATPSVVGKLLDPMSTRPLQNQEVTGRVLAGQSAQLPYFFPTGWMLPPTSKIQLTMKGGTTGTYYATLFGVALYQG